MLVWKRSRVLGRVCIALGWHILLVVGMCLVERHVLCMVCTCYGSARWLGTESVY